MNSQGAALGAVIALFLLGCAPKKEEAVALDAPEQRLEALYAEQDARYAGRYGGLDAAADISNGEAKLLWHGMFRPHDKELIKILKDRFSITAQFVAGCEASPALVNYADAYNARVLEHVTRQFGATAYAEAEEAAVRERDAHSPAEAQPAAEPAGETQSLVILVKSSSDIRVGPSRVESFPELGAILKTRAKANPELAVTVVYSPQEQFGLAVLVLDECRKAGVRNIRAEATGGAPF